MRDQLVRPDRFFATASGATGGTHNRSINTPKIIVDLANINERCLKLFQNRMQRTVGIH